MEVAGVHRKNLVVTCILFLVYYWTGAEPATTGEITFSIISLKVAHPEFLGYFAVAMLCYFTWRYWQDELTGRAEIRAVLQGAANITRTNLNIAVRINTDSGSIELEVNPEHRTMTGFEKYRQLIRLWWRAFRFDPYPIDSMLPYALVVTVSITMVCTAW